MVPAKLQQPLESLFIDIPSVIGSPLDPSWISDAALRPANFTSKLGGWMSQKARKKGGRKWLHTMHIGSQTYDDWFRRESGSKVKKWPFLVILTIFQRLPQTGFFDSWRHFHNLHLLGCTFGQINISLWKIPGKWKFDICEIPIFGIFTKWGHRFGTPRGYFELKLNKHVHFVIFIIYTDFGEVLKSWKIFDLGHILANIWALSPNL